MLVVSEHGIEKKQTNIPYKPIHIKFKLGKKQLWHNWPRDKWGKWLNSTPDYNVEVDFYHFLCTYKYNRVAPINEECVFLIFHVRLSAFTNFSINAINAKQKHCATNNPACQLLDLSSAYSKASF